jgi:Mn2+/Fe2+ NRAMP family transporter
MNTKQNSLVTRLARLGPGLMFAAVAIGVSHLVFSTQAGAGYGLSLVWLVILISLLKFPAFRFSTDYASATGQSLVPAYAKIGKVAVAWLVVGFLADMFSATAAVALVAAGLFVSVFDLPFAGPAVAVGLLIVSALVLYKGQYSRAERIIKILVILFSVLAVIAMFAAVPQLGAQGRAVLGDLTPTRANLLFFIALAGWMPIPTNGAVLISAWVREKRKAAGISFDVRTARNDLRIGFTLTIVMALCFVILGTAVLFDTGRVVPTTAGGFATELLSVFTSSIGTWAYPVISIAAIAVMWSTLIALMDVMPRVTDRLLGILAHRPDDAPPRYATFLAVQVIGCSIILLFLIGSFNSFVFFATSVGFITAPAIAYYNYVAVSSDDVPPEHRPGPFITMWNKVAIAAMVLFALGFIYTNFF